MVLSLKTLRLILFLFFISRANCCFDGKSSDKEVIIPIDEIIIPIEEIIIPVEEIDKCTSKLNDEYGIELPVTNLWHGLFQLTEDKFIGENPVPDEVKGYYLYLLRVVESQKLLDVMSPRWFCVETKRGKTYEESSLEIERCEEAFKKLGCSLAVDTGFRCFKHIYLHYVFEDITLEKLYPNWFSHVPLFFNDDENFVRFHKAPFEFRVGKIREYILEFLQEKNKNLSNNHFQDWKVYCKDRLGKLMLN